MRGKILIQNRGGQGRTGHSQFQGKQKKSWARQKQSWDEQKRDRSGQKQKTKKCYLVAAMGLVLSSLMFRQVAQAVGCPDVRVVFARGSGGTRWEDQNYIAYKETLESKLKTTGLSYEFIDLDYPAVSIGDPEVLLGAYFGAGDAYEFGESVNVGVNNLNQLVNSVSCPGTKYVVGGYSQGAMVVSKGLNELDASKLIYVATFGDPKVYLPEGAGLFPDACKGKNLSDYRMYVPDCQAYTGMLGAYKPYEPDALKGKVGTWCNKRDLFCSSRLSISDHISYVSDNLYEDASRVIFDKICKSFGVENHISSPHDTAILIDSTGSMASMIEQYKTEASRLAAETLSSGGRVALYDYRDLDDPYNPVLHCDFDSCNLEVFNKELEKITADGGGDGPESLLSASFHTMSSLNWKQGSTKSLVILTDANFLSPDRDGMSFDEVVKLSKRIDPVNFYIITNAEYEDHYLELANETDGKVVTNFDELSLLTDYIMERYDSLPRVEELEEVWEVPILMVDEVTYSGDSAIIKFHGNNSKTIVALNDAVLGTTTETNITIAGLDSRKRNKLTLVPLGSEIRGEPAEIELSGEIIENNNENSLQSKAPEIALPVVTVPKVTIPKAPKTGKLN